MRNRVVMTNKTPAGLVRGFGGPQVYFALERLAQRIATQLGLDPLDVYRLRLCCPPMHCFPYRAAAGALLVSGSYRLALARALEKKAATPSWRCRRRSRARRGAGCMA
ncbi:molybdopterin cofactor-binding domain-containing protein [Cupriavidus basilensis]